MQSNNDPPIKYEKPFAIAVVEIITANRVLIITFDILDLLIILSELASQRTSFQSLFIIPSAADVDIWKNKRPKTGLLFSTFGSYDRFNPGQGANILF
jgi:hypothetical protein